MGARAGWYTDPYGDAGEYRYWDGAQWTSHTTTDQGAAAPDHVAAEQIDESLTAPTRPRVQANEPGTGQTAGPAADRSARVDTRRTLLVGSLVVLAAMLVAGTLTVLWMPGSDQRAASPQPTGSRTDTRPRYPTSVAPGARSTPHAQICDAHLDRPDPTQQPDDDLVAAGRLAFPRLPKPWSRVIGEPRMSMSGDSARQEAAVDQDVTAAVRVSAIDTGKGNSDPRLAAELASACVLRTMYGYTMPAHSVVRDQAISVNGHDGWLLESVLDIDPAGPDRAEDDERLIVATVQVAPDRMAMYNATVPTRYPAYLNQAREVVAALRVVA